MNSWHIFMNKYSKYIIYIHIFKYMYIYIYIYIYYLFKSVQIQVHTFDMNTPTENDLNYLFEFMRLVDRWSGSNYQKYREDVLAILAESLSDVSEIRTKLIMSHRFICVIMLVTFFCIILKCKYYFSNCEKRKIRWASKSTPNLSRLRNRLIPYFFSWKKKILILCFFRSRRRRFLFIFFCSLNIKSISILLENLKES